MMDGATTHIESHERLLDDISEWLMTHALSDVEIESLIDGTCSQLRATGIPIERMALAFQTLHPLYRGVFYVWSLDDGVTRSLIEHENFRTGANWEDSPFKMMKDSGINVLRRRLTGDDALVDCPMLERFRDAGHADYFAHTIPFTTFAQTETGQNEVMGSWMTSRPTGFTDQNLAAIMRIQRRLAVACKVRINREVADNILQAYLGMDAGRRVLNGQIRRGDGAKTDSVIWYSDMRRSTALADSMPEEQFLEILNAYFECTAGAILDHGGEVLRFIGDAVLGIFPISEECDEEDIRQTCQTAVDAAFDAAVRLKRENAERAERGEEPIGYGLALHRGQVMYGNIGTPRRLEFSVIGAAANESARLEDMTKSLGHSVVLSEDVARHLDIELASLGKHALRGVGREVEVFTLKDCATLGMC